MKLWSEGSGWKENVDLLYKAPDSRDVLYKTPDSRAREGVPLQ